MTKLLFTNQYELEIIKEFLTDYKVKGYSRLGWTLHYKQGIYVTIDEDAKTATVTHTKYKEAIDHTVDSGHDFLIKKALLSVKVSICCQCDNECDEDSDLCDECFNEYNED